MTARDIYDADEKAWQGRPTGLGNRAGLHENVHAPSALAEDEGIATIEAALDAGINSSSPAISTAWGITRC